MSTPVSRELAPCFAYATAANPHVILSGAPGGEFMRKVFQNCVGCHAKRFTDAEMAQDWDNAVLGIDLLHCKKCALKIAAVSLRHPIEEFNAAFTSYAFRPL